MGPLSYVPQPLSPQLEKAQVLQGRDLEPQQRPSAAKVKLNKSVLKKVLSTLLTAFSGLAVTYPSIFLRNSHSITYSNCTEPLAPRGT